MVSDMLEAWRSEGIYPYFPVAQSATGAKVSYRGLDSLYMLASCDYLGLANDPRLKKAAIRAIEIFGTNISGSIAFSGFTELHETLQHDIARFMQCEDAALFATSYLANVGILATVAGPGDLIAMDAHNHVSLFDGARLSGATLRTFPHRDYDRLERMMQRSTKGGKFIVTDGLFSADGDLADLDKICEIARHYDARVIVDAAHDVGVFGASGAGLAEVAGRTHDVWLTVGTMSKAFGSTGGFVAGDRTTIDRLRHYAPTSTSSRSISPGVAAASIAALKVASSEGGTRRDRLWRNCRALWETIQDEGLRTSGVASPVLPIYTKGTEETLRASRILQEAGILTCAMIAPSVPYSRERLRLNVTSHFDEAQIIEIAGILRDVTRAPEAIGLFVRSEP